MWAAGNGGINGLTCAYDGYVNNIYTIPVSGVRYDGRRLYSTEPCSAIMLTTYSRNNGRIGPGEQDFIVSILYQP